MERKPANLTDWHNDTSLYRQEKELRQVSNDLKFRPKFMDSMNLTGEKPIFPLSVTDIEFGAKLLCAWLAVLLRNGTLNNDGSTKSSKTWYVKITNILQSHLRLLMYVYENPARASINLKSGILRCPIVRHFLQPLSDRIGVNLTWWKHPEIGVLRDWLNDHMCRSGIHYCSAETLSNYFDDVLSGKEVPEDLFVHETLNDLFELIRWCDNQINLNSESYTEGETVLVMRREHLRKQLRQKWFAKFRGQEIRCDICGECPQYGSFTDSVIEVAHRHPVYDGKRQTSLDDLVPNCANCHRVHTSLETQKRKNNEPVVYEELRSIVRAEKGKPRIREPEW